jgi:hypothetical protein
VIGCVAAFAEGTRDAVPFAPARALGVAAGTLERDAETR